MIFSGDYIKHPEWGHFFPDEITINGNMIKNISNKINIISEKEINTVNMKWKNTNTLTLSYMFIDCENITEVDLSLCRNYSVSPNSIRYIFKNCISLTSIYFGDYFKGAKWYWMEYIFYNCFSLISLDLSKMDTSYITDMNYIFYNCSSLISLDLSNFNTYNVKTMKSAFENCSNLKYINLKNSVDKNIIKYTYYNNIFKGTPDDILICINKTKNKILYDLIPNKNCFMYSNECFEKFVNNNIYDDFNYSYYRSIERDVILIHKKAYNINNSISNLYHNNYYPIKNNESLDEEYLYYYPLQDGYFYDFKELIFRKCYNSCKKCESKGDIIYHKCLECFPDFSYEINLNSYLNCYENCSNPHYFDEERNFYCISSDKCFGEYNKFIPEKNECVKNCTEDSLYQYEFRNICYEKCPDNIESVETVGYYCDVICNETYPFELIEIQKCVDFCSINDLKLNLCIKKYINEKPDSEITIEDKIIENIEKEFMSDNFNKTKIEDGNDEVIENEKMTITLTTTKNQNKNIKQNSTSINLGDCEKLLRLNYNLSENETIYIKKIDVNQEGFKIPKVEFDVYYIYNGSKLEKMNLSICNGTKVYFFIPLEINEDIDKLNSSSDYYNNICYTTTSNSGTDITLKDRKNEFIQNNKTVCQENCDFSDYDYDIKKVKCACKYKKSSNLFSEMNINKTKLYEKFKDIKNIANINILKCYKELFKENNLRKNIGFISIIIIIVFHIVCIIIFYKNQLDKIETTINDIIFGIQHYKLLKEEEDIHKQKLNKKIKSKKGILKQQYYLNINDKQNNNKKYKKLFPVYNQRNEGIKFTKIEDNNSPPIKKKKNLKSHRKKKVVKNIISLYKDGNNSFNIITQNKKEIIEKTKKIMEYNDSELNDLSYKHALKLDNRTYCIYYISLLKLKNNLIFTFFYTNDYNSRIIKIDLFFFSFIIYYTVNALFFNDNTMHKIYEDEGSFNFIYQFPQIIYSSLISIVINTLLKFLSLSENDLLTFKKSKNNEELKLKGKDLFNKLKIKFLSYFILSFILLLFFWYYLSMFCAIYKNTQVHLIKDTLISFGLNFIYPFFIYLLPGIFRRISLSNKKNKSEYLYSISKLLQMV